MDILKLDILLTRDEIAEIARRFSDYSFSEISGPVDDEVHIFAHSDPRQGPICFINDETSTSICAERLVITELQERMGSGAGSSLSAHIISALSRAVIQDLPPAATRASVAYVSGIYRMLGLPCVSEDTVPPLVRMETPLRALMSSIQSGARRRELPNDVAAAAANALLAEEGDRAPVGTSTLWRERELENRGVLLNDFMAFSSGMSEAGSGSSDMRDTLAGKEKAREAYRASQAGDRHKG